MTDEIKKTSETEVIKTTPLDKSIDTSLLARLKKIFWINRLTAKDIRSANEVGQAEIEFMKTMEEHAFIKKRLLTTSDRIDKKLQIEELEMNLTIAQLKNKLQEFEQESEEVKKPPKMRYEEQLERDLERKLIKALHGVKTKKALREKRDKLIKDIKRQADLGLTEEERREIENIRDVFDKLILEA